MRLLWRRPAHDSDPFVPIGVLFGSCYTIISWADHKVMGVEGGPFLGGMCSYNMRVNWLAVILYCS